MCDTLFDFPFLTCLTNFIQLDFQLRQSSHQNMLTREFVVFKLRYESFLCCNRLPTVEASLLTQIVFYLLTMSKLVTNIFLSHFQLSELLIFLVWDQPHFLFKAIPENPYYRSWLVIWDCAKVHPQERYFQWWHFQLDVFLVVIFKEYQLFSAFSINCDSRASSLVICLEHLLSIIHITISSFYMLCITNRLSFLVPNLAWVQMG